MISEDFVSYEIAQLLKEKGFDELCYCTYYKGKFRINTYNIRNSERNFDTATAPTHQRVLKWLREKYGIAVDVFIILDESKDIPTTYWTYFITHFEEHRLHVDEAAWDFRGLIYEDATEHAIKYCLTDIIE